MKPEIKELIEISKYYGSNKDYVIAGGGNTSFKDDETIWIKASGQSLAEMNEEGIVGLSRQKLHLISSGAYSDDPVIREGQVKEDLLRSIIDPDKKMRPSVETSLHEIIQYKFVVHLHPTLINGILCSRNAKSLTQKLFGESVLFVPYTDPGYTLFKKLESEIISYREKFSHDPKIIFLENHGSCVSADTTEEIRRVYDDIIKKIKEQISPISDVITLPYNPVLNKVLPIMRILLSGEKPGIIRFRNNSLIARFYQNQQEFHKISLPLTPDIIVYCKTRYLYIEQSSTAEKILDSFRYQLPHFISEYGYLPKVFIIKDMGIFAIDDTSAGAEVCLDIYEDLIKISFYASLCGGIKFLIPEQVAFIDQWEVENYRRKVVKPTDSRNKLNNKIAIVTGSAQGFGAGIAESLFKLNLNVVIADLNEEKGKSLAVSLSSKKSSNKAIFVRTDVSDAASVRDLIMTTVMEFGGLDLMISNAGILKAGGLDEIDAETFSKTTEVNYNGYFHCAKYASEVMRLQNEEKPGYFTDIIQINSKSGLRGSNRNFAYSGAKFGGIGLTQSFAMELAPFRIKVNSICPGNFYEGPLWSDPNSGLFVQYLKTGKVPGAKSIEDVRKFYEDKVPMKRGCKLEDVMKALLYIIDQEYETGQAVPVTGGQVMLG
ncbi:MAG: SDR family NAD(P)-dependent oxidoreductase [Bacteroidales bacterium]|jgi:rhamnose utilization protein RhaD (predicted bifunctional aldolase and dehydrogenase)/NAD(P)-dependent dehydrogenase (short-subunit alcohol dehydrogenase family)